VSSALRLRVPSLNPKGFRGMSCAGGRRRRASETELRPAHCGGAESMPARMRMACTGTWGRRRRPARTGLRRTRRDRSPHAGTRQRGKRAPGTTSAPETIRSAAWVQRCSRSATAARSVMVRSNAAKCSRSCAGDDPGLVWAAERDDRGRCGCGRPLGVTQPARDTDPAAKSRQRRSPRRRADDAARCRPAAAPSWAVGLSAGVTTPSQNLTGRLTSRGVGPGKAPASGFDRQEERERGGRLRAQQEPAPLGLGEAAGQRQADSVAGGVG